MAIAACGVLVRKAASPPASKQARSFFIDAEHFRSRGTASGGDSAGFGFSGTASTDGSAFHHLKIAVPGALASMLSSAKWPGNIVTGVHQMAAQVLQNLETSAA